MRYRSLVLALALLAGLAPRADAQVFTYEPARRGWLGFWFDRTETRSPGETRLTLTVTSVDEDSPAERAGLRKDDAILRINGLNATQQLLGTLGSSLEPGDTVTFQIRRDGRVQDVKLVAAKPPRDLEYRVLLAPSMRGVWADSVRGLARIFIDSARAGFDTTFWRRLPGGDSSLTRMYMWRDSLPGDSAWRGFVRRMPQPWGDSARTWTFRSVQPDSLFEARGRVFAFPRAEVYLRSDTLRLPGHEIVMQAWGGGLQAIAGAQLQELNPELARYFRVTEGVLVVNAPDNTPARRAGLQSGDVITAVAGSAVSSVAQVRRGIDRAQGATVSLDIVRNGERRTIQLKK